MNIIIIIIKKKTFRWKPRAYDYTPKTNLVYNNVYIDDENGYILNIWIKLLIETNNSNNKKISFVFFSSVSLLFFEMFTAKLKLLYHTDFFESKILRKRWTKIKPFWKWKETSIEIRDK